MEKSIQNIELINNFLNKKLSESESNDFENRLKNESNFKKLYEEHIVLLEGIKRQTLKNEIGKGKQSYLRNKWFRYLGIISSGLVVLFAVVYFNVFNSDKEYLREKLNFESEYIQSYQVVVDSIIEIVGEKGTVIRFNPKDLETASKTSLIGDSLNIELIELTTKQDLLLANAQTVSNGKCLISGGAFKIDIKVKNETLVLKQGKTIDVRFPKTTSEDGMQIFYGDKNKDTNMNWDLSNIKLKDKKYYTLFLRDSSVIDEKLTKLYQVDLFKNIVLTDTLRLLNYNNIVEEFPEIEEIKPENDTLRIYDVTFRYPYYYSDNDDLFGEAEVLKRKYISISKSEIENVIKNRDVDYVINEKAFGLYNKVTNDFYESVKLSKLGWINIDKFTGDKETVKIKLEFNLNTNHDEIYIVDQNNNTVLNVYNDEVNLPINRSFQIIAIGLKGKDIYGFKKSFRFKKDSKCKIEYKKINEKQIKSFLTLQNSI